MLLSDPERKIITPLKIGRGVFETCQVCKSGKIIGITSHGFFLLSEEETVMFFSFEAHNSPITITLPAGSVSQISLDRSSQVILSPDRIILNPFELRISKELVWSLEKPESQILPSHVLMERLKTITTTISRIKGNSGLSYVLPVLMNTNGNTEVFSEEEKSVITCLVHIRNLLQTHDWGGISESLAGICGYGRGLTPAGDDCITGFLMTINCWIPQWREMNGWVELNQTLPVLARQKTTSLSAEMIKWAARGDGDERLLRGLDAIMTGNQDTDFCIETFCGMGQSSGADALVGMCLAITGLLQ